MTLFIPTKGAKMSFKIINLVSLNNDSVVVAGAARSPKSSKKSKKTNKKNRKPASRTKPRKKTKQVKKPARKKIR